MPSFEHPSQSEKEPISELYSKAKEVLLLDSFESDSLQPESLEALIAWQMAEEKKADGENTSVANTRIIIKRAKLFLDSGKKDLAREDIRDALLAAENDNSFPEKELEELRNWERNF